MKQSSVFRVSLLMVLFLSISAVSAYALGLNIDPPRVEMTVQPGEEKSGYINIENKDETGSVHVKAYVQDLVYLPDGSNDFLPVGSTPWSFGDAIKIGPTEFDIPAGKKEMVRYVISLPKETRGGRYGVIFFEVTVPPSEFKRIGANVNVRIGSILLATVDGTAVYKAKLKKIDVTSPAADKPLTISCNVYNEGNVLARPNGTVKFLDMNKALVAEMPMNKEKGGVLPNTGRTYLAEYKGEQLKKGSYYAQVVLDYGGEALLGGQKKFDIK